MPNTKNFGAYMDKTLKIIKLNYLKAFKELGLDFTAEQWVILDALYKKGGISQTERQITKPLSLPYSNYASKVGKDFPIKITTLICES